MGLFSNIMYNMKMNRAQPSISDDEGDLPEGGRYQEFFKGAYDNLEVVRRGTDFIVDAGADIYVSIEGKVAGMEPVPLDESGLPYNIRKKKLDILLNYSPNPSEDINQFRRQLLMDLVLNGNCYQYFDGAYLYHLPAHLMQVKTGKKNKIDKYIYDSKTEFAPHEIIHTRDNSGESIYVGESRLRAARRTMEILRKMLRFQELFFENGAIPGLILTTPNILSVKIKERIIANWSKNYSATKGAKRPMILDGDFKVNPLSQVKWQELDFETSVTAHEHKILTALGVPPLLLSSGNNANITPNLKLVYMTTVLPLVKKVIASTERYFGYDLEPDVAGVAAMQPEVRDQTAQLTGLVNAGIITINEARHELRKPKAKDEHADELRIPANIAGSARDPNQGGRPPKPEDDNGKTEEGSKDSE